MGTVTATRARRHLDRPAGVAVLSDGRCVFANGTFGGVVGHDDPAALLDVHWRDYISNDHHRVFEEGLAAAARTGRWFGRLDCGPAADDTGPAFVDADQQASESARRVTIVRATNDDMIVVIKSGREPLDHDERLAALSDATRDLFEADDENVIAQTTVNVAEHVLDQSFVSLWLRDGDDGSLEGIAGTDGARVIDGTNSLDIRPIPPGTFEMEVFDGGDRVLVEDFGETADRSHPELPLASALFVPLGDRGLLASGIPHAGQLAESTVELLTILGRNAGAAFEQAARRRELQERNQRLDEFTSIVSHDLRSPLSVVLAGTEFAIETGDFGYLEDVKQAATRMERLTDDLLTLSRQGDDIGERSPVALSHIASAAWTSIDADEATLDASTDCVIYADRERLRTVFENLFRNALEHGRSDVVVSVGTTCDGFFVEDDGPGIPPDRRDQVLERGYTTNQNGTGFGLSIVGRIADAHGWPLSVTESESGGARFEFGGSLEQPAE
ncbi:GAF domain-containing sensor histidine kinase [Haloarchaeobius sp. DFWS5]|uniref:GAF domain-containing sensor histidine kinase n=1 Tax=Haloarchaeobius sp. DFWS5 TaxID=3446114 RepID=UPI003EBD526D